MALNFNSVEPTQIIAKNSGSERAITFPTGTKTVTVFSTTLDGKKQATATFTSTHNFPANMVVCCDVNGKNNKTLTSTNQLISEQTQASTTYLFYAKFSNNTLSLEQIVVYSFTGEPPQSVVLQGRYYSATFNVATDLTVLKYGTTAVWGKPFSLTFQISYGSEVGIHRDSSPNQHARIGNLGSGATVYYGDMLTITATPASGYKLSSFTINGTEYASGETSAVSQTITVTSAVSIVINTESAVSWKTAWTGSETVAVFSFKGEQKGKRTVTLTNETLAGVDWSRPTKITGVATAKSGGIFGESNTKDLSSLELIDSKGVYLVGKTELHKGSIDMSIIRNASAAEVVVSATCERLVTSAGIFSANLLITKVEQYY